MNRCVWRIVVLGVLALAAACDTADRQAPPASDRDHLIRVSGSDDAYPLVRALARDFEEDNTGYRVVFAPPAHTRGGVAAVGLGEADIGVASRPLTPSERGTGSTFLHLAHDVIVFAAHSGAGVDNLRSQDLVDIYAGRITNWKDVGGPDTPITVLDRSEHTSIKIVLRQQLFGDSLAVTSSAIVLERPDDMIASVATIENAIGYVSFGNAILADLHVTNLAIDGVRPSLENVLLGTYPYNRPFGLHVSDAPSQAAMRFVRFMYGSRGRRTTASFGFAPVTMDLIVAVLPEQNLLAQQTRYDPLVQYLSERLGLQTTVGLELLPDYGTVIEELQSGRVNAAFLGSLAFALAYAQADVEPLVRPEKDGVSQYRGVIVTRKDSGITDWTHLRGRSFGMVDRATTAGHLFPLIWLREHGVNRPEAYLGRIVYTGSHDLLFHKVLDGELDAGAAKDLMLEEVAKSRPEITESLRTLAVSPPVPNNAFVMSKNLDFACFGCHELVPSSAAGGLTSAPRRPGDLRELLSELLLGLHESPEGAEVLRSLGADRFVRTTVEDLSEVNRMIEQAGSAPENYRP